MSTNSPGKKAITGFESSPHLTAVNGAGISVTKQVIVKCDVMWTCYLVTEIPEVPIAIFKWITIGLQSED